MVERFQLKAFVEAVMVVDEGVATTKDVDLGMMMGAGILPGTAGPRRRGRPRRDARAARAGRARVGRRVRGAPAPAAARESGTAGQEDRPGILLLPAGGRRLRAEGDDPARDARRTRDLLAQSAPDQPDLAAGGRAT